MEDLSIEKVTVDDAKCLVEIYGPYVEETAITFEYEIPTVKEFEERIRTITEKFPYIKAVKNGEVLGYAYANTFRIRPAYNWSVETTVYVKKDCRQMGVGRLLYDNLENMLKKMGIRNMNASITCTNAPSKYLNDDSLRFHKCMGFKEVGKFTGIGYKFNNWFDMMWMEKHIGPHEEDTRPVQFGMYSL